jgi:hypothetical protein
LDFPSTREPKVGKPDPRTVNSSPALVRGFTLTDGIDTFDRQARHVLPGGARLATSPLPTGSPLPTNTIGMTDVARLAAIVGGVAPLNPSVNQLRGFQRPLARFRREGLRPRLLTARPGARAARAGPLRTCRAEGARGHLGLSEVRRRDRAALRRVRGEVHGRRRPRVFRLPASARGRCRASSTGGAGIGHCGRRG